ncbi:hypothetical protein HYFRA_00003573 [Hymenoscyphus fraxineus]|uniref:Uncharacterized protein n=1 Tax=Hymenoscyphus fraxineus TaxID=746836 RepID=A0A9N9PTC6_9HELO|nr:hypothetical protein HYFRA_00003573 [Hymenoscyphus fraxineus]
MENSQQTPTQTKTTQKSERGGTLWNDFENALFLSYHFKKEALGETWAWLSKQMIREFNARGITMRRGFSTSSVNNHYLKYKDALYAVWGKDGVKANAFIAALDGKDAVEVNAFIAALDRTVHVPLPAQPDEMVDDEQKDFYHWSDFEKALLLSYIVERISKAETWAWVATQMKRAFTQRDISLPRVYSSKSVRNYFLRCQNALHAEWGDDGVKADAFIDALDRTAPMPVLTESRRVRAERERDERSRKILHWNDFEKALLLSLRSQQEAEKSIWWEELAQQMTWEFRRRGLPVRRIYTSTNVSCYHMQSKKVLVAKWGDDGVKANAFIRAMDRTAPEPLGFEGIASAGTDIAQNTAGHQDTNQLDPGFEWMTPRSYKKLYDELHLPTQEQAPVPSPPFDLPIRSHDIPGPSQAQAQAQPTQDVVSEHPYGLTHELYMLERENQEILDRMGVTEEEFMESLARR